MSSNYTYIIPGQVWYVVDRWAKSNSNVVKVEKSELSNPRIGLNTRIIVPKENLKYETRYSILESLYKLLIRQYPKAYISPIRETAGGSTFYTMNINTNKDISIKIYLGEKSFTPRALRAGLAFEDYVSSIIKEGIAEIKEYKKENDINVIPNSYFNLTLNLHQKSRRRTIKIPGITSVVESGKNNNKVDIKIYSGNPKGGSATETQISLKQNNFAYWSSANKYNEALTLFEKNVNNGKVPIQLSSNNLVTFADNIDGIYFPATSKEVLKYCFGENEYAVDYIVIGAIFEGIDENFNINVNCGRIYSRNIKDDLRILARDVYLLISSDLTSKASAFKDLTFGPNRNYKYTGLSVDFVNKFKINKGNYVEGVR